MNIKLMKLRITNKKLKSKLKDYKIMILLKNKTIFGIKARADACYQLINSLEDTVDSLQNENKHYKKLNEDYMCRHFNVYQKHLIIERDLSACKRKLAEAETIAADYKVLNKDYKGNVHRLSINVSALTKENESLKGNRIANKLKNILKEVSKMEGSIYKEALDTFGIASRLDLCIEEMSELMQALCKCKRGLKHNVEEEMVDVEIMLEQLRLIFNPFMLEGYKFSKLHKLENTIKEALESEL